MNYELEYNGVINLTHTLLGEYFDSLLSFSLIQSGIFILWIEILQNISFKSALAGGGILFFLGPQAPGDCFTKRWK